MIEEDDLEQRGSDGSEALSQGQRSLWFLHHLAPVGGAYNIAAAARVLSPVDVEALDRAFRALIDRHAALRTTFPAVAGVPRARIAPQGEPALVAEDASGWSLERLRARLSEESWRPFDLERGPLLRVRLWTGCAEGPVLLLVIHHIVADFWSLALVVRELPLLYRGLDPGPPGLPYAEHVRREREAAEGEAGAAALAFWQRELAGLPALELATDRPRPAVQTYRGGVHRHRLAAEPAALLRALGRARHGTLFMTLTAAFQALLARHAGQEDLAVGTARAGRSAPALAGTVGYCVNHVVLRGDLSGDPSFAALLERTKERVQAAFAHGDYPFSRLAERLQPERDASRTPLFQVSFALQKETRGVAGLTAFALGEEGVLVGPEDFRLESLAPPSPPTPFDLVLQAVDRQGGLSFALQFNADLFDATTALRLLGHFENLLQGAAAEPGLRLSELPLLAAPERAQVLVEWNGAAVVEPAGPLVHELVLAGALRSPEALAVVEADRRLTYGGLAACAGRLAARLRRQGVGPEVRVALCADTAIGRVVGSLGILLAGGASVLIDPEIPPERLAFVVADSAAAVVLTARDIPLPGEEDGQDATPLPLPPSSPDHLAYVVYTSGSTGRPKGVAIPHAGLLNLVRWHLATYGTGPADRATLVANPAFDASVWELWPHLVAGASLHVPEPAARRSPTEILRFWRREGITWSFLPTPLAEEVLALEDLAGTSLRGLLCGGDRLHRSPRPEVPFPVINHYGPSEVSVVATAAGVPAGAPGAPPIGRPIDGLRAAVVDPWGGAAPLGAVGELWLGGAGVARGYLGRPDLTAERFVPDPWSGEAGGRLYRTGDRVRLRSDGSLEFLGRLDHQIKLRGFRIEPGEIEAALRAHPAVGEVVVAAVAGRLVAWVAGVAEEAPPSPRALREHLPALLPAYMVPSAWVVLPALPRTANGKIDRRALPASGNEEGAEPSAPPRTPVEELLAGIFAEVLGVPRIGRDDSFFELGGHSLAAARLTARLRETFGVELPLSRVFATPTVAELAVALAAEGAGGEVPPLPPILPVPRDRPLPLSFAQQRLWFLHQLEPASPLYNMPAALHLAGAVDAAILAAALGEVVRRHEALRTRLVLAGDEPVQVVDPPQPFALHQIDLAALPTDRRPGEAERLARAEALTPFDLARGPLLRAGLVHLGEDGQILLLTLHHVVGDGWSLQVLARELGEIHRACGECRPPQLPALPVQYADYAAWQRGWLHGERLERELAYWRARLAGAPPVLELPLDRPRPAVRSPRAARRAVVLPPGLQESLQSVARQQGVTLFMAALAAFQALLARAGGEDVSVGTPVAGRGRVQIEGLIGFFVNTLVLRTDLSGDPPFAALLARVRESALAAYAHQDLPFEKLVEELHPQRDLSHAPLVQVTFALDDPPPALRLGAVAATLWPLVPEVEKLDLSLTLGTGDAGLSGELGYRCDLFDGPTIERLAQSFARLLAGAVADPRRRLSALPLLAEAEQAQLLVEWNDTAVERPGPPVPVLVLDWARRQPQALAVAAPAGRLTYGELAARAGRLARRLLAAGVRPEVRVALCAGSTVDRVVGGLAVLLAGGAYVPLDPEAPAERLVFQVADAGAAVVLCEHRLAGRFAGGAVPVLELEAAAAGEAEGFPSACPVLPEHLAYVVYTSGSTGRPKGVAISHAGLLGLVRWHGARYGVGPGDRATLFANPAFDAAVWEIWPYLAAGASLHIPAAEVRLAPPAIVAFWRSERITWSFLPTPLAEEVIAEPAALAGLALQGLLCGGDRLHRAPGAGLPFPLINHYGPSEVSVVSTVVAVPPDVPGAPPIGRPIDNLRVHVADRRGGLAPRGAAGELWIGGAGLARGYLGQPALTAERFVPDPWSPGERLYRTGDLVRRRADGDLEFLGRIDQQIKLRGFRIEPGEIEAALRAHPAVGEAVVGALGGRLVAWVVAAGVPETPVPALQDHLRASLPAYMVPSAFVVLPALPLTPHGKLDRAALPAPAPDVAVGFLAPRTPLEERLSGLFAEVLGVERVGVEDDFFALGGHSLLAARLATRVRAALGVELAVRTLFETPTVAGLARVVERSAGVLRAPLVRVSREQPPVLSFAQQQLWILERIEPGTPLFHLPAVLDGAGHLDPAALAASVAALLDRHEVLRTRFALSAGRPVQIALPSAEAVAAACVPLIDLSGLPAALQEGEREVRTAAEIRRPFDLERGPLLRAAVLRLAAESHRLLLTTHHIAADAWSLGLLLQELGQLYAGFAAGRPVRLPELPVQYADFAVWQRDRLRGEHLEGLLGYWRERLGPRLATLELPTDRPRPPVQSHRGARLPVHLEAAAVDALRRVAAEAGATLFMAVLAVFQVVLARHAGQEDVAVGTAVADRPDPGLDGVVGLFLNTLVLRSDLSGDPAFRGFLGQVREVVLGALAHAELPFERLVEALQPERDLSRSPLFQVFFALRNEPLPELDLPGLALRPAAGTYAGATQFDLSLHLEETPAGLDGWIELDPALFDGTTVERLAGHCGVLLAGAAAAPGDRLSALPLLSAAETAQLVVQWNDTRLAAPGAGRCIHELFQAQVERTPGAVAVRDAVAELTWRELDEKTVHLARRLLHTGVRPGDRVGVCVERSPAMLVAVLGVLRAGAAYVPLDPAYPQARLAAMLEDSQAAALIASPGTPLTHPRTLAPEADEAVAEQAPLPQVPAAAAAYVIYTSGSTGVPKGVVVSHRNATFFFAAMDAELRPEGPGVWLAVTSICFDISVLELLWTLTRGFQVVIHDGRPEGEGASIAELIARHGVSHLQCTPSMAGMLAASPERLHGLAPLSRLLLGGEALPAALAERLCGTVRGEVRNLYGPTETTVWSLGWRVEGEARPLIGRPLANTEVYLLDPSLRPVPAGSSGEVFLGGEGVATGYWRRPDLTAERFLPDPLGSRPGGRLYRTGDLARHRPDGCLDFLGRADHQVKVRGVRMELGEIETVLATHPAVAQAVVGVREDARGDRRLIAWLVPAAGAEREPAAGELRRHLAERLPEAMIPSAFVPLAALPLTQNGKVDRRALPAPEAARPRLDSAYAPPRTAEEKTLAAIWQEVLGHERIGIHDNFFELGGSSLLLVEIESRLRQAFGREVPIVLMFRHPTIEGLARELAAGERRAAAVAAVAAATAATAAPTVAEGSAVDRQRQFLEEMKRKRAQQRRPGR